MLNIARQADRASTPSRLITFSVGFVHLFLILVIIGAKVQTASRACKRADAPLTFVGQIINW